MRFRSILEQFSDFDPDSFEYKEQDIRDAIIDEKPYIKLKEIFQPDLWPKVERWLNNELKNIKINDDEANRPGGIMKAKLEKYLEVDTESYESNIDTFVRSILNAHANWDKKEIKDLNLPKDRFKKGGNKNA